MSDSSAAAWLASAASAHPRLSQRLSELGALREARLWHQVTDSIEGLLREPELSSNPALLASFYDQFIAAVGHRLSPLRLAQLAGAAATARAASEGGTPAAADAAAAFLEAVAAELSSSVRHRSTADEGLDGPVLLLRSLATQHRIRGAGGPEGVRPAVRELRRELERQTAASQAASGFGGGGGDAAPPAPPPAVSAAVHATAAALAAADGDAGAFYRASLARLAFVAPGDGLLSAAEGEQLALDVGAAALLADDVYSFGELLLHPLIAEALGGGDEEQEGGGGGKGKVARGGKHPWLGALLRALADGDLPAFEAARAAHSKEIAAARPAVAEAAREEDGPLRAKARVCALFALAASLPPEGRRSVPLSRVAEAAGLKGGEGEAEFLVMKAVAKGLVRATIDGVEGSVHITWVAPRVLTLPQVADLSARLRSWLSKVDAASAALEAEGGVAALAAASSPPSPSEYSLTRAMNALLARQRCPCSAKPARDQDRPAVAARPAISSTATAAFRTKLGGGEAETTHDGSSPVVLRVRGGATSLSLEERAGRVYATAELDNGSKKGGDGGGDGDGDLFFSAGPPPPSGVFLAGAGAELRPGTSYLLSPGAEISFTDAATGGETSVTVDYEVSENDGIGGLGEMLARAMAAQASDEVRAKLDDVF